VASFCTKCGAALSADTQFCTTCGAPAGAVAPVAPYAQPPAAYTPPPVTQYPPPAAAYPAAAPPNSGSSAIKIILIIVGVFVGLGILGVAIFSFTVWRVARAVHVNGSNGEVTVNTPGGRITANQTQTFTASELGTDIYPGAESGHGSMKMDLPTGSMVTGVFVTPDSKDQVVAFYKSKFGSGASIYDTANSALLTLNRTQQEAVMVTVTADSSQDGGKTRISIVHTKSNKAS
jgi:zinc-ribbon domain